MSGAGTAMDLWAALAPHVAAHNRSASASACVVPFFVQIDNGYLEPAGPGDESAPPGFLGLQELAAFAAARAGVTAAARQAAQIAFDGEFDLGGLHVTTPDGETLTDRYARVTTLAHPGSEAPLGWTLSRAAFDDLVDQLGRNQEILDEISNWFQGMTCEPTPA